MPSPLGVTLPEAPHRMLQATVLVAAVTRLRRLQYRNNSGDALLTRQYSKQATVVDKSLLAANPSHPEPAGAHVVTPANVTRVNVEKQRRLPPVLTHVPVTRNPVT